MSRRITKIQNLLVYRTAHDTSYCSDVTTDNDECCTMECQARENGLDDVRNEGIALVASLHEQ